MHAFGLLTAKQDRKRKKAKCERKGYREELRVYFILKMINLYCNIGTMNFQMFKLVLERAEEPEIKLPTSAGSLKKQESSIKTSISALLTMPNPLTVWITTNCGKF